MACLGGSILAGCDSPSKSQDFAGCEMKAADLYPHWKDQPAPAAEEATDYIFECMTARGYTADSSDPYCRTKIGWLARDSELCYRKRYLWD